MKKSLPINKIYVHKSVWEEWNSSPRLEGIVPKGKDAKDYLVFKLLLPSTRHKKKTR